jgi:hypothetical protein
MFVLDMHNYVLEGLQNMNSNLYRGYESEEIDLFLNRAMSAYFDKHYLPLKNTQGFEQSNKRYAELSSLVVDYYKDNAYIAQSSSGDIERVYNNDSSIPTKFRLTLPDDYAILTRCRPRVFYNDCSDIEYTVTSTSVQIGTFTFITNPATLGGSSISLIEYESNFTGSYSDQIDPLAGNLPWASYNFPEDGDSFLKAFIIAANAEFDKEGLGVGVYWEAYKGLYYPGKVIIVQENNQSGDVKFDLTGITNNDIYEPIVDTPATYKTLTETASSGSYKYARAEMRRHGEVEMLLANAFHGPNSEKVLYTEHQNFLDFYTDEGAIVKDVVISYIRKPKAISLSLNQGCELNDSTHAKICDLAIAHIKAINSHQNYQAMIIEAEKTD